jgi:hypothetical protein
MFILTESNNNIALGYYTLSSSSVIFDELPKNEQKKFHRHPQLGATLLGRFGVHKGYSLQYSVTHDQRPRLGELLLLDSLKRTVEGIRNNSGAALMIIDVKKLTPTEVSIGLRDPLGFYMRYGFNPFPGSSRRLYRRTKEIEQDLVNAGVLT